MKNILFFPNYLGGGFGHIGRCLSLADAWTQQGGSAFFALDGPHAHRVSEAGYEYRIIGVPRMHAKTSGSPAYVYVSGMDYQIVRDGFDHPQVVEQTLREAMKIIDRVKPDLLLGDGWPLTYLLGHRAGLPVVQMVKSVVCPNPEPLAWWEPAPPGFMPPDPGPVFNPVLLKQGLPPITRAEELLKGDLLLFPSLPELDPTPILPDNAFYVGSIIRCPSASAQTPGWLTKLDKTKPIVYISVGGAAGHGGASEFFHLIITGLHDMDCQIVISSGGKYTLPKGEQLAPNMLLERWVPNWALLPLCDAVVFHGGYTRMEILENGLPSVVIPFHSEQEFYGRQLAKNGCALCLPYSEGEYSLKLARWRGGNWMKTKKYSVHFRPRCTLTPAKLRQAVEQVLNDREMKAKASHMKEALRKYGGSEQAVTLIRTKLADWKKQQ
jgi:UDP:flavonoid glycosyltransferase YjiC (YdhE family)